jgi:hypothetical protein
MDDTREVAMLCPTCQTVLLDSPERCPACGERLRPTEAGERGADGEASRSQEGADAARGEATTVVRETALVPVAPAERPLSPLARISAVPAAVWSRPAVRAAVKTGASVVALSLALRLARQALAARGTPGRLAAPALPRLLAETLPQPRRSGRRGEPVSNGTGAYSEEVFIFARRVVRS